MININNNIRLNEDRNLYTASFKIREISLQSLNIARRHATVLTSARTAVRRYVRIWQIWNEWKYL